MLTWNIGYNLSNVSHVGVHSAYLYPFNVAPKIEQLISLRTNLIERGECNPRREVSCLIIRAKSEIAMTHLDRCKSVIFHFH